MEVIATKERKTVWVAYTCAACILLLCFVAAVLIFLLRAEGWTVFAWCALIMVPPVFIPWGLFFDYLVAPSVLAEYDGRFLYLHGRKKRSIPVGALSGADILQCRGSLMSRCVILIVTADRTRYKIKYAQDPSAVCRRLEKIAYVH